MTPAVFTAEMTRICRAVTISDTMAMKMATALCMRALLEAGYTDGVAVLERRLSVESVQ